MRNFIKDWIKNVVFVEILQIQKPKSLPKRLRMSDLTLKILKFEKSLFRITGFL